MAYPVFIQDEWMIPAIVDLTGRSEKEVRKVWKDAKEGRSSAVLNVPGEMPETKACPSCDIRAREDAMLCVICGHLYDH